LLLLLLLLLLRQLTIAVNSSSCRQATGPCWHKLPQLDRQHCCMACSCC
jgi:hypothetical protein